MKRVFSFLLINMLSVSGFCFLISLLGFDLTNSSSLSIKGIIYLFFWGFFGALAYSYSSSLLAKSLLKIQTISQEGPHGHLVTLVHKLSRRASMTVMPQVGIYQSKEVNIFSVGMTRQSTLIALSSAMILHMSEEEIEGALAHEISHISNGDTAMMVLTYGVINSFVLFFVQIIDSLFKKLLPERYNGQSGLDSFGYKAITTLFEIIFGFISLPMVCHLCRQREYRADYEGAGLTSKEKIIKMLLSLKRLQSDFSQSRVESLAMFRVLQIRSNHSWFHIFKSHPTIDERVAALEGLAPRV